MPDVLDWVKKRIDDTATLQKARPARADAPADQRGDPLATLADLTGRLKAAGGADIDAKTRSAALASIQDKAADPVAALLAQYLGLGGATATPAEREATWKSLVGFQLRLAQAMCASAAAGLTAEGAVRALGACRVLAKLHLMNYAAVAGRLWHVAYALHAGAEKAGFATTPVHAQSDPRTTTAEQELLRLLMLHVSAPDMLTPEQIECADRVIERLGTQLTLRQPGVADSPFCFEPASELAPARAKGRPPAATTYIAEIRKITQAPIKFVIYSHHHYDHIEGGKPFKDLGATGIVQGDVNGNGTADFEIKVNVGSMIQADFLL